jgi:hypothetical protein
VASEPLPFPCPLHLRIQDDSTGESLRATGQAAWAETRRINGREVHVVGVRFDEVLAPPGCCTRFFKDESPKPPPAPVSGVALRRSTNRFPVAACSVRVHRKRRFALLGNRVNLATKLHDLSRAGAHVVCTEAVKPGERVRLVVHLEKFHDTFEADAVAVWVRFPAPHEGLGWRIGLAFDELDPARARLLASMESWFTHLLPPSREAVFRKSTS